MKTGREYLNQSLLCKYYINEQKHEVQVYSGEVNGGIDKFPVN